MKLKGNTTKKKVLSNNEPFNPCTEAKIAMQRHNDDTKAGHKGADEYWLGQATAYGAMCANKKHK